MWELWGWLKKFTSFENSKLLCWSETKSNIGLVYEDYVEIILVGPIYVTGKVYNQAGVLYIIDRFYINVKHMSDRAVDLLVVNHLVKQGGPTKVLQYLSSKYGTGK